MTRGGSRRMRPMTSSTDMSFLEMIDVVNERLTLEGREPIAIDSDCREGICGMCGTMVFNGQGPRAWRQPRPFANYICANSTMVIRWSLNLFGPERSRSTRIWSLIAAPFDRR